MPYIDKNGYTVETLEEYLARGGKITYLPAAHASAPASKASDGIVWNSWDSIQKVLPISPKPKE